MADDLAKKTTETVSKPTKKSAAPDNLPTGIIFQEKEEQHEEEPLSILDAEKKIESKKGKEEPTEEEYKNRLNQLLKGDL